jgi:hypothetical protein
MLFAACPRRRLRVNAGSTTEEACWNHSGIVQDDQFVSVEKVRKIAKGTIRVLARMPIQEEKSRRGTIRERTLSNPFRGQLVVEFVETHGGSLAASQAFFGDATIARVRRDERRSSNYGRSLYMAETKRLM